MIVREQESLAGLTTLRVGGTAAYVIDCIDSGELKAAFALARERGLPTYLLGSGSNVLALDAGFEGVLIRPQFSGTTYINEGDKVLVEVGAGVIWDALLQEIGERGLWGIENLAGIPGTAGAAPVQNIGAYGCELKDTLHTVQVYDSTKDEARTISATECALGYRDSRFKREPHLVITGITLSLSKSAMLRLDYADIKRAREAGASVDTPIAIANTIRGIRAKKFPDLSKEGTAGSFFKNPFVTKEAYEALLTTYPELPGFPTGDLVKIPLAWILDKVLALRGYRLGPVRLFEQQPLVLVAESGATANDVDALADDVTKKVFDATGVTIEREVRVLGK